MRISDWSSDVCSSDLPPAYRTAAGAGSDDADAGGFGAGVVPRLPRLPSRRAAAGPGRSEGVFRNAGDVAPLTPPSRLREGRQACTHPPPPLCPLYVHVKGKTSPCDSKAPAPSSAPQHLKSHKRKVKRI